MTKPSIFDRRLPNRGDGPTDNPERVPEIFERRELNRGDAPARVGLPFGEWPTPDVSQDASQEHEKP